MHLSDKISIGDFWLQGNNKFIIYTICFFNKLNSQVKCNK